MSSRSQGQTAGDGERERRRRGLRCLPGLCLGQWEIPIGLSQQCEALSWFHTGPSASHFVYEAMNALRSGLFFHAEKNGENTLWNLSVSSTTPFGPSCPR